MNFNWYETIYIILYLLRNWILKNNKWIKSLLIQIKILIQLKIICGTLELYLFDFIN